jgi:hypothetical protein
MCTTLWHETDEEIETLLRSLIRLIMHAKKKEKLEYEFEINIFFDNSFESKNSAEHHAPDDHLQRWKVLNPWVNSFLSVLKKVLTKL